MSRPVDAYDDAMIALIRFGDRVRALEAENRELRAEKEALLEAVRELQLMNERRQEVA